jgi:diguanylate cyclase (GGDEF)-like protein
MEEMPPFLSRLGSSDVETLQAISSLLATVWVYRRLGDATKQAQSDGLTGLLNRGAFEMRAMKTLQRSLTDGHGVMLAIIDCDHFKLVNDTYGHLTGDKVLSALADCLRENFRQDDLVSRIGGDEFAICCKISSGETGVINKIARLSEIWSKTPFETGEGKTIYSTLSIGIAISPADGTAYDKLFHHADIALYKAKQQGRNQYAIYDANDDGHSSLIR